TLVTRLLHYQLYPSDENSSELLRAALLQLYTCLLASIQAPAPTLPSVLPHALQLFQAGLFNPALTVRQFCQRALTTCSNLIHPRLPALPRTINAAQADHLAAATAGLFPVPLEDEETDEEEEEIGDEKPPSQSPQGPTASSLPPPLSAMAVDEAVEPSDSMCIASPEPVQTEVPKTSNAVLVPETSSTIEPAPMPCSAPPMALRSSPPAKPSSPVLPTFSEPLLSTGQPAHDHSSTLQPVASATVDNAPRMTISLHSATQTPSSNSMTDTKAGTTNGRGNVYGDVDDDDDEMLPSIVDESSDDDI
ncbi:hypothetical protein H4R34_005869, partial [Dimargaris verticillata]